MEKALEPSRSRALAAAGPPVAAVQVQILSRVDETVPAPSGRFSSGAGCRWSHPDSRLRTGSAARASRRGLQVMGSPARGQKETHQM